MKFLSDSTARLGLATFFHSSAIELFNNSDAILNRDALWSIQGKNHHVNAAIVRGIRRTGKILR